MKLTNKQKAAALAALRRLLKGPHWEALNERRSVLIDCEYANAITSDSLRELEALQALASLRRMTLAPYPTPRRSNNQDDQPGEAVTITKLAHSE